MFPFPSVKIPRVAGIVASALFLSASSLFAEPLRYVGSDFLKGEPEKNFSALIAEAENGEQPVASLRGSVAGIDAIRNGDADFGILMMAEKAADIPEIAKGEWKAIPFAYQVAYIVVPRANPIMEISFSDLSNIFGQFAEQNISDWREIDPNNPSTSFVPIIGDIGKTNAVSFFQKKVLAPKYSFNASVKSAESDENALKDVRNSSGAIAVVGTPVPPNLALKTLAVSQKNALTKNQTAYLPTPENLYNGDYPLTISVYIVYPAKNREKLIPAFRAAYSDTMAEALSHAGFVPIPEMIRKNLQKNIDKIK